MIKRIVVSVVLFLAFIGPVIAQQNHRHNHRHNHYQNNQRHYQAPQPRRNVQHHHHQRRSHNNNGFATVLGMGLLGMGVAGAYYYSQQVPSNCRKMVVGYDYYGREVWEVRCR
jgi:Ni/Co efflux regulator RcnB